MPGSHSQGFDLIGLVWPGRQDVLKLPTLFLTEPRLRTNDLEEARKKHLCLFLQKYNLKLKLNLRSYLVPLFYCSLFNLHFIENMF